MVYKRYIKRGGKIYGPYNYYSKKKDGKVISVYLGKPENTGGRKLKNYLPVFAIIFGLLILLGVLFTSPSLTGNAVLNLQKTYSVGDKIDGSVKLILKQGELIPSDSKVFIDNGGEYSEYPLSELINMNAIEGNFYVEGKNISGSGLGYGLEGEKRVYPEFSFVMKITKSEEKIPEENVNETTSTTTEQNESSITPQQNETESPVQPETQPEETQIPTEEIPSLITGAVILEENLIEGSVSKDKPYFYELSEGESAEIISSEHDVKIKIENNIVEVTTDYYENEKGFGEEYITGDSDEIEIDLSLLGIVVNEGMFVVKLLFGKEEIV